MVGRESPAHPGLERDLVQLQPGGAGRPGVTAGGSGDHANDQPVEAIAVAGAAGVSMTAMISSTVSGSAA